MFITLFKNYNRLSFWLVLLTADGLDSGGSVIGFLVWSSVWCFMFVLVDAASSPRTFFK